ncbi:hypothetical protein DFQ30_000570 [Apophysomyces sp. BC1015]|nr:hypothetical protein DFQ30_000570 [Apophysomyces sp. BC1015]
MPIISGSPYYETWETKSGFVWGWSAPGWENPRDEEIFALNPNGKSNMKKLLCFTRKAHEFLMRSHIAALRIQVRLIHAKAEADREASRIAWALVETARNAAHRSTLAAMAAEQHAIAVEQAARTEAATLGGQLYS